MGAVDFWVGLSFRVPDAFPALEADTPILALVRNIQDVVVPVPAVGRSAAETAVFLSADGTKLRFVVSSKSTPTDLSFPIERDTDVHVTLRIRRNSIAGTLRWFLNGDRVVLIDGDPVGNVTLDAALALEPTLVLALEPGWSFPRTGAAATLLVNSLRVARGPDARALVETNPEVKEEPPVDPAQRCVNRDGALLCPCGAGDSCLDDGALCGFLRNETGVCDLPLGIAVPANCSTLGTVGCPCYRLGCRQGITCDRSGAVGPINFCFDARPAPTSLPPNPETGYSCVPSTPAGMFPIVPGPADWFVVIMVIVLLTMSLIRWSVKLYGKDHMVVDDDQIKMMTENGVLSTQLNFAGFSSNGSVPPAPLNAEGYDSASHALDKREFYKPLPPVLDAKDEFSQYRKLPDPPMLVNAPQLQEGALQRRAHQPPATRAHRSMSKTYAASPIFQLDASGKRSWSKTVRFLWHRRIPGSQVRLRDAFLAVLYVLLHVLFFVGFQDPCLGAQIAGSEWRLQARAVGTTFGHMAAANSLLLVVPATRNSILTIFLGLEFDETILFHRWLAGWTLLLLAVHGIAYFPIWFDDWDAFVAYRVPLPKFAFALASGVSAIVIGVMSLPFFRRNYFQVFYWVHYTFIIYMITGGLHSEKVFAKLAIAAMAIYVVDRVVRFAAGVWPRRCIENVALQGNCTRVVFSKSRLASYAVGNYVFLNFPQISLTEWHPFTLSSGPHDPNNECHIKALGDFTTKVFDLASKSIALGTRLWVRVDGPYGKFSLKPTMFPVIVLVGGGVGITPQVAALKSIYRVCMSNVARIDNARHNVLKHVYFVWTSPDPEHYSWFADLFAKCLERRSDDPSYPELHLIVHLTKFSEVPPGLPSYVRHGRPDFHALMPMLCVERKKELTGSGGAVFACGPTEMVNGVWDASIQASSKHGANWFFHRETFDF